MPGKPDVKVIIVIPARYSSKRYPGKVLAKDTGKFLIQHTFERAALARLPEKVLIATDDQKVVEACRTFGAECVPTGIEHNSGTDRIAEAVKKIADSEQRTADSKKAEDIDSRPLGDKLRGNDKYAKRCTLNADDIIVNLQADEPEIEPGNIDYVAQLLLDNPDYPMATLAAEFQNTEQIADPNIVKVIVAWSGQRIADRKKLNAKRYTLNADCGKAIYFSRAPIPYDRGKSGVGDIKQYLRHLGIYAYRREFLLKITALPQTPLEKIEKLEQLRAIENGFAILVGKVEHVCDGIDTQEQYAEFVKRYKKQ
jgi:3-deoxy-manno-octulosonate cytidylyltransferase (CMP-KDO synthetase)